MSLAGNLRFIIAVTLASALHTTSRTLEVCNHCDCDQDVGKVVCVGQIFQRLPKFPNWTTELQVLECHILSLRSFSFPDLPHLKKLWLVGSSLKLINPFAFAGLSKLTFLDLSDNPFQKLPDKLFNDLPSLKVLNLSRTSLDNFAPLNKSNFPKNVALETLDLENIPASTKETNFSVILPSVQKISLRGSKLTKIYKDQFLFIYSPVPVVFNVSALTELDVSDSRCFLAASFLAELTSRSHLEVLRAKSAEIEADALALLAFLDHLKVLDLDALQGLQGIWLDWNIFPPRLQYLNLASTGLNSIIPRLATELETLILYKNKMTRVPDVSMFPFIKHLDLSDNMIAHMSGQVPVLGSLHTLNLCGNNLMEVYGSSVGKYPNLRVLKLCRNRIYFIDQQVFSELQQVEQIDLSDNVLADFVFGFAPQLKSLDLSANSLVGEGLIFQRTTRMSKLERLSLDDNQQLFQETAQCTAMEHQCLPVWLDSLIQFSSLRTLGLRNTGLYAWPDSVLRQLTDLTRVDLSQNYIGSAALSIAWNKTTPSLCLESLNMSGNSLRYIPNAIVEHLAHPCLYSIDLSRNPFDCSCDLAWAYERLGDKIVPSSGAATMHFAYRCYLEEEGKNVPVDTFLMRARSECHQKDHSTLIKTAAAIGSLLLLLIAFYAVYRFLIMKNGLIGKSLRTESNAEYHVLATSPETEILDVRPADL